MTGELPGKLKAAVFSGLMASGIVVRLHQILKAECLLEQVAVAFHDARPSRRVALPEGRTKMDFAAGRPGRQKAPPLVPPCFCKLRSDPESARPPTLLFAFVRTLLRFNAHTPAFELLFQFALTIGHMLRRLLYGASGDDPAANHSPHFVN